MSDYIDRQAAIDARRYTFGNDEFSLEAAYHDCKLVFDGITDDDSFQEADTGLILYYANEIIYALHEALSGSEPKTSDSGSVDSEQPEIKTDRTTSGDLINRQDAINAFEPDHSQDWYTPYIIEKLKSLPSAQSEDYAELKREFLRMASYIDVLLECSDVQKETLIGFISRLAEFMPWTERD